MSKLVPIRKYKLRNKRTGLYFHFFTGAGVKNKRGIRYSYIPIWYDIWDLRYFISYSVEYGLSKEFQDIEIFAWVNDERKQIKPTLNMKAMIEKEEAKTIIRKLKTCQKEYIN